MSSENKDLRNNVVSDDSDLEYIDINKEETAATPTADSRRVRTKVGTMLLLAITILAVIATCIACNSNKQTVSNDPATPVGTSQPSVEDEKDDVGEVVVTPEVTEEPLEEGPEVTDEPQVFQTVDEWAMSLDDSRLGFSIWSDETKQGTILEEGQEYLVNVGDYFVIRGSDIISVQNLRFFSGEGAGHNYLFARVTETIKEIEEIEGIGKPIYTEVEVGTGDGTITNFNFYVVLNNDETNSNEGEPSSVEDWVAEQAGSEIIILVSNEFLVPQLTLGDGDSYVMKQNEYLWAYFPDEVQSSSTTANKVTINEEAENLVGIYTSFIGSNVEIPITVEFEDGTTREIVIYITKEWDYDFSTLGL